MSSASLTLDGKSYELPVIRGVENETAVDITKLLAQSGAITMDPGFNSTGACKSAITFIDGDKGILRYRGYPIEQLAERSDFVETSWLLLYGELPTPEQLKAFRAQLTYHSMSHEDMKKFFEGFPPNALPMAILSAMVSSLSTYYPEAKAVRDPANRKKQICRLIAKAHPK